jgi:hypothetical protein
MRKPILALAFLAVSHLAYGDMVVRNGANELRLMQAPCTHEGILSNIKDEFRDQFRQAQGTLAGKTIAACWIDTERGAYFVMFSDGDSLTAPVSAFINSPGV